MNQLYVKHTNDYYVAHLYEHVVSDYVCQEMQKAKYIASIDYVIVPQIKFNGSILISVWADSKEVYNAIETAVYNSQSTINKKNIVRCVGQLSCEAVSLIEYDVNQVRKALVDIAKQPWLTVENMGAIDVGSPGVKIKPIKSKLLILTKAAQAFQLVRVDSIAKKRIYDGSPVKLYIVYRLQEVLQNELRLAFALEDIPMYWTETRYYRRPTQLRISQELICSKPAREEDYKRALKRLAWLGKADLPARLAKIVQTSDTAIDYAIETNLELYAKLGILVDIQKLKKETTEQLVETIINQVTIRASSW